MGDFLKKNFKVSLLKKNSFFALIFVLQLLLYHCCIEKQVDKRGLVWVSSSSNIKIIFALLSKLIAIYIKVFIV